MLGKNDILDSLLRECEISKHLATKIPDGDVSFQPCASQRSMLDLMRYQSFCGLGGTYAMFDGNWDRYRALAESSSAMEAGGFAAAIDQQADGLREFFGELTDEAFATRPAKTPMGEELPLGRALLELPVKWMTAYRMQMYLYCKQAGNDEIWTPNCWAGIDMERPPAS
ncbi:MAG: hypothetical protein ACJA2W_002461 [Planctomycetota bacterium]|jgi:hypothetical protein